jgi:membrane protease subunit HflK
VNDYNKRTGWQRARAIFSLNDPRWGRGDGNGQRKDESRRPQGDGNGGPPDLDQMWRDFNRRLSSLFGRKGNGRGPGGLGPRPDNGRNARIGVGIVIGVLIAIYLGSGVFVVQEGQAAVVLQFGQYRHTVGQGVHWRLPYPFQTHETVNIGQIRSVEVGRSNLVHPADVNDASLLTRDGDILEVRFTVQYQVKQPTDYLFNSADPDLSVTRAAQAAVRTVVGAHATDDLLYAEDREPIRAQLADTIQRSLDGSRSGLEVTGVTIQSVQAPQQVQAAFDDAAKAHQDRERATRDARAAAEQILPKAQADAARMIDEAKAYSDQVVAQAQGDAERFNRVYEQYAKAPDVIRHRMYLETMQHIYSNATKVFVDSKSGNNVLYLPLDKIAEAGRQRAAAANGASAAEGASAPNAAAPASDVPTAAPADGTAAVPADGATAPGAATPPPGDNPLRSRDAFRDRDRQQDVQ